MTIDWAAETARFSGSGTFQAKEEIKKLGAARWVANDKVWELRSFNSNLDHIKSVFPGIKIEEIGKRAVAEQGPDLVEENSPSDLSTGTRVKPKQYSVSELLSKISSSLAQIFPTSILVHGVLTSVKHHANNNWIFLDLGESSESKQNVGCVIWSNKDEICSELHKAGFELEPDLEVMFEVSPELSKRTARISLRIIAIDVDYTLRKLAAVREKTNNKLIAEGIFADNKGKELAFLPEKLGILTSAGGTVINDFLSSLEEGKFGFELFWLPVAVQGKAAVPELVKGLETLGRRSDLDAILLFRGGGSAAELGVFNDYKVAKAICLCPLPVLTAIGHQEDQTSAQDVSYRAFGVPKEIGAFFADIVLGYREGVELFAKSIVQHGTFVCEHNARALASLRFWPFECFDPIPHKKARTVWNDAQELARACKSFYRQTRGSLAGSSSADVEFSHSKVPPSGRYFSNRCQAATPAD